MLECFLLIGRVGSTWGPLIAIPVVIAGSLAALCLTVLGSKGLILNSIQARRRSGHGANPKNIVNWIGKRPLPNIREQ